VVPEDITGPFGNQCQGVSIAAKPARPAPAAPPVVTPQEDEPVTFTKRKPGGATASGPAPAQEKPEPVRIPAPRIPHTPPIRLQSQTTSFKARPLAPAPSNGNNGGTTSYFPRPPQKQIIKIAPPTAKEQTPAPLAFEPPAPELPAEPEVIPFKPVAHVPARPAPAPKPAPRPSAPQPTPMPSVALSGAIITMSIVDLWEAWPDAVKDEITQLGLTESKISVPLELIEAALKQGRVSFSWRLMRSWVRPAVEFGAMSPHEGAVLDLPLKVVAPAFLSRHREAAERKRVELAGDIPDIWSGSKPASFDTTVTRPKTKASEQTNYYVWDEASDSPAHESAPGAEVQTARLARPPSAGGDTNFATRFSSPNEVVKKATSIPGIAGALVALEDGLLVASSLTHDVNGDTLAAFIPQAFVRVSQTTKELMMGELNNLNFTLGTTPWKIFRVGSLYFAVYGRPGEPLPTARIAGLAAELERKPR
jgi:predicted regulator of Ras-like GTPase activity (Roadblock/LC7/MglB family)